MSALNWITVTVSVLSVAISVRSIMWTRKAERLRKADDE